MNVSLREFDELYTTWKMASRGGYLYFEGNGVQGLANLMASPDNYDFFPGQAFSCIETV